MLVFHLIRTAVMPVFVRVNLLGEGRGEGPNPYILFCQLDHKKTYQINLIKINIAVQDAKQKTSKATD